MSNPDLAGGLARVRTALLAHAGGVDVVAAEGESVTLRFTGACSGCPARPITMAATVRPVLAEHGISEVTAQGVRLDADQAERLERWMSRTPS